MEVPIPNRHSRCTANMTVAETSSEYTSGLVHNSINNTNIKFSQYKDFPRHGDGPIDDDEDTLIFTLSSTDNMDNDDVISIDHGNTQSRDDGPSICFQGSLGYRHDNKLDDNDNDIDVNHDDLTYSSSDESVNPQYNNIHRITISKENRTPYGPRRRNRSRVPRSDGTIVLRSNRNDKQRESVTLLLENHRIVDDSTQSVRNNRNSTTSVSNHEVTVKTEEVRFNFAWLIEVNHDRSGLWFKLKMPGGSFMRLLEDEIIDCVKTLVEEPDEPSMEFLIKGLDGRCHLADASHVVDVLISTVPVGFLHQQYKFVNYNVSTTLTPTGSVNRTVPSRESTSSVLSQSTTHFFNRNKGDQRPKMGKSLRKRIGTVWGSLPGPYKRGWPTR